MHLCILAQLGPRESSKYVTSNLVLPHQAPCPKHRRTFTPRLPFCPAPAESRTLGCPFTFAVSTLRVFMHALKALEILLPLLVHHPSSILALQVPLPCRTPGCASFRMSRCTIWHLHNLYRVYTSYNSVVHLIMLTYIHVCLF